MGEISVQRGDLSEALTSFEAASASTGELLARSPSDGHAVFNHAQSVFWVGEMAHQRGDLDRAEAAFADYRDLAERLIAIDGSNDDWRAEIAYAQSARGVLLLEKGDAAGAVAAFQESLAVVDLLARRKPTSVDLKLELGQGHAWLADALEKEGRLASARKHRLAELSMYVDILAADGSVRQAKFSSIVALQTLGRLAILVDDWEHARQSFTEAASRAEALLSGERDNMDLTAVVAIVNVDLGEALLAGRRINDALIAQRRADTLLATARAHDAAVALWLNYGDRSALLAAEIARSRGDAAAALQLDESVLTRLAEGPMPRPNTDSFLAFVRAHVQAGDDLTALGRERDARQEWQAVIDGLPGEPGRYEPKLLKILAAAELRLGKAAEARQITERLLAASKGDPG
jgi:tetratricopeptide (TPR) repeat protein